MPSLPGFEIPDEVEDLEPDAPTYGTSWAFDFEAGDFTLVGGRIPETDGYRAWADWCVKTVLTQRFQFLAYSDDYGTDLLELKVADTRAEALTMAEHLITDALESDPRTGSVHSFEFAAEGDTLNVSFTIEPTVGTEETITVSMKGAV